MLARYRGLFPYILVLGVISTLSLMLLWSSGTTKDLRLTLGQILESSTSSSLFDMEQSDPRLIEHLQKKHLTPPSREAYNLSNTGTHANGFSSFALEYFKGSTQGVFIEAGAYDGEGASNSLHLELLGWKGILVECNPELLPKLYAKRRKAWIADVCLSPTDKSSSVKFFSAPEWPASAQIDRQLSLDEMKVHGIDWIKNKTWVEYERPSFPLYPIIAATGEFTRIDFLSLDVQGAEIGILKNYPFDKVPIKLIILEVHTFPEPQKTDLKMFMFSKGYELLKDLGSDYAFVLK